MRDPTGGGEFRHTMRFRLASTESSTGADVVAAVVGGVAVAVATDGADGAVDAG